MPADDVKYLSNDKTVLPIKHFLRDGTSGNVTSAPADAQFTVSFAGTVQNAILTANENGADSIDALNLEVDVLVNGTTVFTTKPKLDKTAGTGRKSTASSGTGITQGVVNEAADDFAAGDNIELKYTLARTTPDTEMADVAVEIELRPLQSQGFLLTD